MTKLFNEELVKQVRDEVGACNQTSLTQVAVHEFIERHSKPNGQPDIKGIAQILSNKRKLIEIERKRLEVEAWDKEHKAKK